MGGEPVRWAVMTPYGAVVLITGASRGIGAATAEAFDRAGARVALAARSKDGLEKVAGRMKDALVVPTDISDLAQARTMVERTVAHFGRLDVLINNAAAIQVTRSDKLDAAATRALMETNFIGPMVATQVAAAAMRESGGGQIINVGSVGYLLGLPMMASYVASKAALSGWTRAMQAEWVDSDITVTEFFPGYVETGSQPESDLGELGRDFFGDPNQSALAKMLVREQRPEEIARMLVECVRNPKSTAYSSPTIRLVAFLGLFSRIRVFLGSRMASRMRARLGASVFTPRPANTARSAAKPAAAAPDSAATAARAKSEVPSKSASPATKSEVPSKGASPATGGGPVADTVNPAASADEVVPTPPAPPVPASKASAKKAATKKATTKKVATKKAATKTTRKRAATKKAAAKKPATKRAAKKVAVLSPEATERVRAAAERAAASAKGSKPSEAKREDESDGS